MRAQASNVKCALSSEPTVFGMCHLLPDMNSTGLLTRSQRTMFTVCELLPDAVPLE